MVVFGLGGVFTEVFKDTTLRLAPLADADVREMFAEIRAHQLLGDFRGMPKVNVRKLSRIMQAVGNVALLHPEFPRSILTRLLSTGQNRLSPMR